MGTQPVELSVQSEPPADRDPEPGCPVPCTEHPQSHARQPIVPLDDEARLRSLQIRKLERETSMRQQWLDPKALAAIATAIAAIAIALVSFPLAFARAERAKVDAERAELRVERALASAAAAQADTERAVNEVVALRAEKAVLESDVGRLSEEAQRAVALAAGLAQSLSLFRIAHDLEAVTTMLTALSNLGVEGFYNGSAEDVSVALCFKRFEEGDDVILKDYYIKAWHFIALDRFPPYGSARSLSNGTNLGRFYVQVYSVDEANTTSLGVAPMGMSMDGDIVWLDASELRVVGGSPW